MRSSSECMSFKMMLGDPLKSVLARLGAAEGQQAHLIALIIVAPRLAYVPLRGNLAVG